MRKEKGGKSRDPNENGLCAHHFPSTWKKHADEKSKIVKVKAFLFCSITSRYSLPLELERVEAVAS